MGDAAFRAILRGTRGSVPVPGPRTLRFGGNTPCLEVRAGDRTLVFDAGTGIRSVGGDQPPLDAHLFLTHFHWDHVQGLPFFAPLYRPDARLCIHAPPSGRADARTLLRRLMSRAFFPVPFDAVPARIEVRDATSPWRVAGIEVASIRVRHVGPTVGYRVRAGGATMVFVPDCELRGADDAWRRRLVAFARGADLLLHDAMYTTAEYATRAGWGHSTFADAVRLAEDADVARLLCFHHAPERTDDQLDRIGDELRAEAARRGSPLRIDVAAEGQEIDLAPAAPHKSRSRKR